MVEKLKSKLRWFRKHKVDSRTYGKQIIWKDSRGKNWISWKGLAVVTHVFNFIQMSVISPIYIHLEAIKWLNFFLNYFFVEWVTSWSVYISQRNYELKYFKKSLMLENKLLNLYRFVHRTANNLYLPVLIN